MYGDCYCVIKRLFEGVVALCIERSIYYLYDTYIFVTQNITQEEVFFSCLYKKIHHHFELNDMILNIIGLNGCYKKNLG